MMEIIDLFQILQNYRTKQIIERCYLKASPPEPEPDLWWQQPNQDLPDNLQWYDMGIVERKTEHLDPVPNGNGKMVNMMNDRHFRECCVQYGGRNYAFKLKTKADLEPPNFRRPEWIAEQLEIEIDLAKQITELIDEMNFDRNTVMRLFYGRSSLRATKVEKKGRCTKTAVDTDGKRFCWTECTSHEIARDIGILREIKEMIEEPDWSQLRDDNFADPITEDHIYMTDEVLESISFGRFNEETNEIVDDMMDDTSSANPFGVFPLYWGAEALSHEFIQMIKEADWEKIKQIQARFYPQYDPISGRTCAPEYWYLTSTQKSQAWIYIKDRKEQLSKITVANPSESYKQCLHWVRQFGKGRFATGMIFAFAEGRSFNALGQEVVFEKPGQSAEIQMLWNAYRNL